MRAVRGLGMRRRDLISLAAGALSLTAAFVLINTPLPADHPADAGKGGGFVVVTEPGTPESGSLWDCPEEYF
ncbi:hypothetical protein Aca07nite_66250 [Actinoplanes capillaceus]|uniref:Tat (Twin-arginine translocation) pathway signal sequence n=2 Tax=Actinoplanes campanulatus TaxID=113559 RepID=A0ABQ3WT58_9ACTN|nr:hypothetical protein Aca07nite_66250 [Actinoplanes capillaceus]